ncbi:hypothetical protein FQU76_32950 [Streptomyces qinzhouensis]|uniref:Uncharacterized protein n=1 Tax=Streptomyces qinzhouensis TaxID=2599401 RepID=A0A5B8IRX0_9ACTN|nr:hypothetical protein FQU76_32950 [Streptomyces qinzhouensis]
MRPGEFDLAVQLGCLRTLPGPAGGPPTVAREEIARLLSAEDRMAALRRRVSTVGTRTGAELISISPQRFTRLARTGRLVPVRFYLNRYRKVVWRYLADDVEEFARSHPELLTGRTDPELRALLDAGADRRPRTWRGKRLGLALRITTDPWERAAAAAVHLDPSALAELVPDAVERSRLDGLRPRLGCPRPASAPARELVERLTRADAPDEIEWYGTLLAQQLDEARRERPAPRPGPRTPTAWPPPASLTDLPDAGARPVIPAPLGAMAGSAPPGRPSVPARPPQGPRRPRGRRLLDRLRRGSRKAPA